MERTRQNEDKYKAWKKSMHESYVKRKKEGKVVPISSLSIKQKKIAREKSRKAARRRVEKNERKKREPVEETSNR